MQTCCLLERRQYHNCLEASASYMRCWFLKTLSEGTLSIPRLTGKQSTTDEHGYSFAQHE